MAISEVSINETGEKVINIDPQEESTIKLATANTYVDKNIIININELQSDWEEQNSESKAYIRNKPNLVTSVNGNIPNETGAVTIEIPSSLPEISADDNGKSLIVINGSWAVGNASADADIATVDEVQQFLNLEIPDLTEEEF